MENIMDNTIIRFNNDYNHLAHESVLQALNDISGRSYAGYGTD